MGKLCAVVILGLFAISNADPIRSYSYNRNATLKPLSVCCEIPEIGEEKFLLQCSNPRLDGPCKDVQCIFEKSGFLIDNSTLNKEAYKTHLLRWSERQGNEWNTAVERAIQDCVDKDTRQYLDYECKAYDVFACTGIALVKRCPDVAWKC